MADWFARWVEAERGRFFLLLPVAMGAAILGYFALPAEPPLWVGGGMVVMAGAALGLAWGHFYGRFAAALALAAALGFARAEWRTASLPLMPIIPAGVMDVQGRVAGIELLPGTVRLTLDQVRLDGGPPMARDVRVKLRANDPVSLVAGETVRGYGLLFGPERPAWPGGWDVGRDEYFAGLAAMGAMVGDLTVVAPARPGGLAAWVQTVRADIATRILAVLPPRTGAVAVTLLTGDEQSIPADERQDFIAAGLAHILAVAGLHVGIVMGLAFGITRFLLTRSERLTLRWPVKPVAAVAALLAGGMYALLTGAHLPILRSLAMAGLVTAGIIAGRRAASLRGLAMAALALMLATPEAVLGVSFQMSFSAVLALISGYAAVGHWFTRFHATSSKFGRVGMHLLMLALTSLLAGGASMPFAAFQFGQMQPYWILANLVAVPLTAFWIMPLGLLALGLMPLHLAAAALVPMGWGIGVMVWLTRVIAAWPDALLRVPALPVSAMLAYAAGLSWLCIWRGRGRWLGLGGMVAALVLALGARPPDVLISADARLVAIRAGGSVYVVEQPHASRFVLAQWQGVWGGVALTPAACSAASCRLGAVLYTDTPVCPPGAGVRVIVSPALVPACPGVVVLDRRRAFLDGAVAAWVTPAKIKLRTDAEVQGRRPWVVPVLPVQ
ncbi:ComEC/Rec2 family competence protein [Acidocella sp.]|uniref:ComEC/Rec2 family competence protein n=1 Tax=Acidocella sp. TaxID=50710 RepID=UPI002627F1C8|nr:ComEC/Rec2 family competence protein [Acidocella sp.]